MNPVLFIAGEASGDAHAAAVIRALRREAPDRPVCGAGGPRMQAAGAELLVDLTKHAVVGVVEVLKHFIRFVRLFRSLLAEVDRRRPAAVVLVDFPGFNLRFARAVKRRHPQTKVIYYISPQLWGWHASRARLVERHVDLMLTIFPFEKDWYATHAPRLRVEFVGHPLADIAGESTTPASRDPKQVLLLPGSREAEINHIFPILAAVVDRLPAGFSFVAAAVDEPAATLIRHPKIRVDIGRATALMRESVLALAASGTATMECAFARCPTVVVYKVNWFTGLLGWLLIRVKWLAMPNLIAGREIMPEFIQRDARPDAIAAAARALLEEPERRAAMERDLADVVSRLGGPGAAARAARWITAELADTDGAAGAAPGSAR